MAGTAGNPSIVVCGHARTGAVYQGKISAIQSLCETWALYAVQSGTAETGHTGVVARLANSHGNLLCGCEKSVAG